MNGAQLEIDNDSRLRHEIAQRGFLATSTCRATTVGAVSLMKIATHLNRACIETARMMILAATEADVFGD